MTAAGTIAGNSVLNAHTDGQIVELELGGRVPTVRPSRPGRVQPHDPAPPRRGATCGSDRRSPPTPSRCGSSLRTSRCHKVTGWPLRRRAFRELRSVQEYVGSTQPVLMDWAVGLAFPCQQPMLHTEGVTEVPRFRITPPTTPPKSRTPTPGEDGRNGGLLGISDLVPAGPRDGDLNVSRLGTGLGDRCEN